MIFSSKKVADRWDRVDRRARNVTQFVWWLCQVQKLGMQVTSTIRTPAEDKKLKASGVHQSGRAVDVQIFDTDPTKGKVLNPKAMKETARIVNTVFPRKGKYKTAIYHRGTGWHIHLQVSAIHDTTVKLGTTRLTLRKP